MWFNWIFYVWCFSKFPIHVIIFSGHFLYLNVSHLQYAYFNIKSLIKIFGHFSIFDVHVLAISITTTSLKTVDIVWGFLCFEDTKGAIRIRKLKKNRQNNGDRKKDKRTNNDLQNITHKTKDRGTRTPLKTESKFRYSGRIRSSCSTSGTRRVILDSYKHNDK